MIAAGLVLLVIGFLLGLSEAHNPSHGIAGGGGLLLMAVGVVFAVSGLGAGVAIGLAGGVALAAVGGGALTLTVKRSSEVRRLRVRGGAEGLIGQIGTVRSWTAEDGNISVQGATWRARRSPSPDEDELEPLHTGDRVVVERLSGLTLSVRAAEDWELL
jgi:membrane-bound ClpP family serine protease